MKLVVNDIFKSFDPIEVDWEYLDNFDWIQDMKTTPQDLEWHAEGNVYIHTKMVVGEMLNLPEFQELDPLEKEVLVLSAIFHDIEKRSTTQEEVIDGTKRITSPRHAKKGEFTVRSLLYYNSPDLSFSLRETICKLVRHHGLPLWAITKSDPHKEVITSSLVVSNKLLYLLAKADVLGRVCNDKEAVLLNLELFKELSIESGCYDNPKSFNCLRSRYMYLNEGKPLEYTPYVDYPDFKVTMMSGIPGSGKDTYINNNLKELEVISLDSIRRNLNIKPTDKKGNGKVIQAAQEASKTLLRSRTFVFNATNITSDMRSKWVSLFKEYKAYVEIVYVEVPFSKLISQNHDREYKVPETVVNKLIGKLEIPHPREVDSVVFEV